MPFCRTQPLETQCWTWAQIVRNQPHFFVFATKHLLRTLKKLAGWHRGAVSNTKSLTVLIEIPPTVSNYCHQVQGQSYWCMHPQTCRTQTDSTSPWARMMEVCTAETCPHAQSGMMSESHPWAVVLVKIQRIFNLHARIAITNTTWGCYLIAIYRAQDSYRDSYLSQDSNYIAPLSDR